MRSNPLSLALSLCLSAPPSARGAEPPQRGTAEETADTESLDRRTRADRSRSPSVAVDR